MGRRRTKDVYAYTGAPEALAGRTCATRSLFIYKGWTLLAEYADTDPAHSWFPEIWRAESWQPWTYWRTADFSLERRYTWGPDLSGTMGGAGDIGEADRRGQALLFAVIPNHRNPSNIRC